MADKNSKPTCIDCKSSNVYVTDTHVKCRRCGSNKKREVYGI